MKTKIINLEQYLLYTTEEHQLSKTAEFVIVTGCHIYFWEVTVVISLILVRMNHVREEKW